MQGIKTSASEIPFRRVSLDDKALFVRYVAPSEEHNCDLSFANLFCWQDSYHSEVAEYRDFLLIRFRASDGQQCYMQPIGRGDRRAVVEALMRDAEQRGAMLRFAGLTAEWRDELEALMPGAFAFAAPRAISDYIYLADDLATLPGRRYQPKRNHINRFVSRYGLVAELLTVEKLDECRALNERWCALRGCSSSSESAEQQAMARAFECFEALGLRGLILYADGRPAAFTYGSPINHDTFCTHVEKSDPEIEGAAIVVNRLFAESLRGEYRYINREDDLGLEGLRFSKMSYHPVELLDKYEARLLTKPSREVRALWQQIFGDSREDVDRFIVRYGEAVRRFVHEEQGCVVSMLHVVPLRSGEYRVAYSYAVATDEEHRGRGIASRLIEEALAEIDASDDFDVVALIPSGAAAQRLYARHGFEDSAVPMLFRAEEYLGTGDVSLDKAMLRPVAKSKLHLPTQLIVDRWSF